MIEEVISRYVTEYEVEVLSNKRAIVRVPEEEIPHLLGKRGRRIKRIENELKVRLEIQPLRLAGELREVQVEETGKHYIIHAEGLEGQTVDVFAGDEYLFTAAVSKKGIIKVRKDKEAGKSIRLALMKGEKIYIRFRP